MYILPTSLAFKLNRRVFPQYRLLTTKKVKNHISVRLALTRPACLLHLHANPRTNARYPRTTTNNINVRKLYTLPSNSYTCGIDTVFTSNTFLL